MYNLTSMNTLPPILTLNSGAPVRTVDDWRARRREIIDMLSREEYGYTPAAPEAVRARVLSAEQVCAGKAEQRRVELSFDTPGGEHAFEFNLVMPVSAKPVPAFVALCFRPEIPDKYLPMEEIADHGFAVASIYYQEVTADGPELDGLAAKYPIDPATGWGKIGIWAFAASRVMDYLETLDEIDHARVAVVGHSRLGKTALWCGAQDERFSLVISNDSGCSGAAISRGKAGETIQDITNRFPFWFCGNYKAWANREYEAPFDQHWLLALVAPRRLYVCSATEDEWAGPASEYRSAREASAAWRFLRAPGLTGPDELPAPDAPLHFGSVAYHLRTGPHFQGRADWNWVMKYREATGV